MIDVGKVEVTTEGRPRPLQDWLKKVDYSKVQKQDAEVSVVLMAWLHPRHAFYQMLHSQVDEECPKCGHEKASFTTVQLRSVDEGSTVFYECLKCHHHWSENN